MADKLTRVWLTLLGLVGLLVGLWATVAPRSFYDDFPAGERHAWVAADGPYNEHLIRDVGALNLSLAAVAVVALVIGGTVIVRAAALAWLVYSLPHLVYHGRHLHLLDTTVDKVFNVIALTGAVVVATALLVVSFATAARARRGDRTASVREGRPHLPAEPDPAS
jgi:hypothetical protein